MNSQDNKKKGKGGKIVLIFLGVCVFISVLAAIVTPPAKTPDSSSASAPSVDASIAPEVSSSSPEVENVASKDDGQEYYLQAQEALEEGRLVEAKELIESALKKGDTTENQELQESIKLAMEARKEILLESFDVKEDKIENITFITPKDGIGSGLIFYPYIGIKDSKKYMLLRIGYQEPVDKSLIAFTGIKVRTDDELRDISFNALNKKNNVDILGSGMTEFIDVSVKGDILTLLETDIPQAAETLIRFDCLTNQILDYELSDEQKQTIAEILECYQYIEEAE